MNTGKKIRILSLLLSLCPLSQADNLAHTLQISSNFQAIYGRPTWELVMRDTDTGRIWPYMFEISQKTSFWTALIIARNYRITISKLQYGPFAQINNFCCLENMSLTDKSLTITLSGHLSPVPSTFKCNVVKYPDA